MLDDLSGGDRAKLETRLQPQSARFAGEEAGGEQITRAGGVDQPLDRFSRDRGALIAPYRDREGMRWQRGEPSLEDVFIELMTRATDNFQ